MSTFKINNINFPHPIDFAMQHEPNKVSEIVTMSGKTIADINGWKYSDATLKWNWIESTALMSLLTQTDPMNGAFAMTFIDSATGTERTISAIRESFSSQETPTVSDGKIVWTSIQMALSFPDCYQ